MHTVHLPDFLPGASLQQGSALLFHPTKLFVEPTGRSPKSGAGALRELQGTPRPEGDLDLATFNSLQDAFPTLDALVLNGVGEPLLNTHLEQFVSRAKKLMPAESWVGFQSNGILLTNMRAISLLDAGLDRICLSMEGGDGAESGGSCGSPLLDLEWALKALESAKSICGRPSVQVGVEYVVEQGNLEELPAALEWAAARGATFAVVSGLGAHQSPRAQTLPAHNEVETFLQACRQEALSQGIDLSSYFEVLWKSHKSKEERRVIHFVAALKEEALRRGVTLDLRRLVESEGRREERVEVLERAQAVAARTGLDLRLPEVACHGRRCTFVERGGAFVSWDGGMHPCYRLWRRCSLLSKRPEAPQQHSFGNVLEKDVLQIWNSAPFRAYRQRVVESRDDSCRGCDYPSCDSLAHPGAVLEYHCGSCLWTESPAPFFPQQGEAVLCLG